MHTASCTINNLVRQISEANRQSSRIALSGDGALGKSVLAMGIARALDGLIFEVDGYMLPRSERQALGISCGEDDRSLDWATVRADLSRLDQKGVRSRRYDHSTGTPVVGALLKRERSQPLIIDGSYLLTDGCRDLYDFGILLDATLEVRAMLRYHADIERGYRPTDFQLNWTKYNERYTNSIAEMTRNADIIVAVHPAWKYTWQAAKLPCTCLVEAG
jgi:uridine kinase